MVVEDDPLLREVTAEHLQNSGYVVLSAASADEALHYAQQHRGAIDLLLTDVIMPQMNGRELAARFRDSKIPGGFRHP